MVKRIGILTSGGDCSGLNAAIRAVVFSAIERGWEVYGIHNATNGLILRPLAYHKMSLAEFEFPFATLGGTMLGTTNQGNPNVFPKPNGEIEKLTNEEIIGRFKDGVKELGLEALIVIGGDGSMNIVSRYCKAAGVAMVGIPKTIDNDAPGTDLAIGFATARTVVADALDKLNTTAGSHQRVMVVEVMGRGAGHLALESAIAGFADVALIPEIPYTYEGVLNKLKKMHKKGCTHSLVVVAEGIKSPEGKNSFATNGRTFGGISEYFVERLSKDGFNVRGNVLGHIQRSGNPVAVDRILASGFGVHAVELLAQSKTNRVVAHKNGKITDISLEDALKIGNSPVDPNGEMVRIARQLGIYVGE